MSHATSHGQWASRFAFIMAASGAAVGLGNIWKFPYMAGENGGSVFVLCYLACLVLIGIPVMIGEVSLGRLGRRNPIDSLSTLAQQYRYPASLSRIAYLGIISLLMVLGFYSAISGWSLAYIAKSVAGDFGGVQPSDIQASWVHFLSSPLALIGWHTLFMCMTLAVVARGVNKGIELASKWMMPALFILLFCLMIYGLAYGDAQAAIQFLFQPDWSKLSPHMLIDALGQALFTLAVGAGAMLVYGAYLKEETQIGSTICIVALLDALVALFSGLAIFPLVFSQNLDPAAGPDLMFQTLPIAFSEMSAGYFVGSAFFSLLLFAAWTSSISMAEPLVMMLIEKRGLTRPRAALLVGLSAWSIGLLACLSFNVLSDFHLGSWGLFDILTDIPTNWLLPIGALAFSIIAGWFVPAEVSRRVIDFSPAGFRCWQLLIRYVAPVGILLVFLQGIL